MNRSNNSVYNSETETVKLGWWAYNEKNKPQGNALGSEILLATNSGIFCASILFNANFSNDKWTQECSSNFVAFSATTFFMATIIGALLSVQLISSTGKKKLLHIPLILFYVSSCLLMIFPKNAVVIMVSRILGGFATGVTQHIFIIHGGEIAVPKLRGMIMSSYSYCFTCGLLIGSSFSMYNWTEIETEWDNNRIYGICILTLTFFSQVFLYAAFVESPLFLLQQKENTNAIHAMMKLRNEKTETDEILHDIFDLKEMIVEDSQLKNKSVFTEGNLRPLLKVICTKTLFVLSFCFPMNFIRINFMNAVVFDLKTNITFGSLILSAVRFTSGSIAIIIINFIERKKLIMISGIMSGLFGILIGIFILTFQTGYTSLAFIAIFCILYDATATFLIAIPDVVSSEAFPILKKPWSVGIVIIFEQILQIILLPSTFSDTETMRHEIYLIPIIIGILMLILTFICNWQLPETRKLTLRECRDKFKKK